jgi:hypothetical protein
MNSKYTSCICFDGVDGCPITKAGCPTHDPVTQPSFRIPLEGIGGPEKPKSDKPRRCYVCNAVTSSLQVVPFCLECDERISKARQREELEALRRDRLQREALRAEAKGVTITYSKAGSF